MTAFCVFGMTEPLAKALAASKRPPRNRVARTGRMKRLQPGALSKPNPFWQRQGHARFPGCWTPRSFAKTGLRWQGGQRAHPA